jgi:hypothetical protein
VPRAVVDAELELGAHAAAIGGVPLAAFCGEDLPVPRGILIRGGDLRLVDEELSEAHAQPVAELVARVAVVEDLGADVSDSVLEKPILL